MENVQLTVKEFLTLLFIFEFKMLMQDRDTRVTWKGELSSSAKLLNLNSHTWKFNF